MSTLGPTPSSDRPSCCCGCGAPDGAAALSRRDFLKAGGVVLGTAALAGCAASALRAEGDPPPAPARQALVVKPVFMHDLPRPRPKSSWRPWGGVQTPEAAADEQARIRGELERLKAGADFPLEVLPLATLRGAGDVAALPDLAGADAVLVYPAGGPQNIFDALSKTGKRLLFFVRHKSGPVYLWYEIIWPRYLRQHTDAPALLGQGIGPDDVVVDSQGDLEWRLRALVGLKNTLGSRIVAIGGPGGWACPKAPDLARQKFKLDIQTVSYEDLGKLIQAARADDAVVQTARRRADAYLRAPGVSLETERPFVDNAFLLDQVFRDLMQRAGARAITVHHCMGAIMPVAETTACLTLTTLNDDGYMAFCESDFVAIPAGLLTANIAGRPSFLNNPTFPHGGIMTQAHCTAPRRMNGKTLDPVRIVTHMESDWGAAPKVELRKGQKITDVITDFAMERWSGLLGEIVDTPYLPICRSQMDVAFGVPDQVIIEHMRGFHWMTLYGDYTREVGYAVRKVPLEWEVLG